MLRIKKKLNIAVKKKKKKKNDRKATHIIFLTLKLCCSFFHIYLVYFSYQS